jgi:hypothetical protein
MGRWFFMPLLGLSSECGAQKQDFGSQEQDCGAVSLHT